MDIRRAGVVLLALVAAQTVASAQQPAADSAGAKPPGASQSVHLSVVVSSKSGAPVTGLTAQDFTVLDNKQQRPITSFKAVSAAEEPVRAILILDTVNANYQAVAYAREGMENFFRANEGKLAYPTTFGVLADKGAQIFSGFSEDGNQMSDALEKYPIDLRTITTTSEWGDYDRFLLSVKAMQQAIGYAATLPGRKLLVWVSPGWPLISGPHVSLQQKQEDGVFDQIVDFSTQMRQANIAVYDANTLYAGSTGLQLAYEAFLNEVNKPNDVALGNLALQVLAKQSGGLSIEGNSDVAGMIEHSMADAASWYEIEFAAPPPDKPNAYHRLEVKVDKQGATARTSANYYSNPVATLKR